MVAVKKDIKTLLGAWAFLIGVVLAVVIGLFSISADSIMAIVLVLIGLIIGLFNIGIEETMPFLFASVALVIVGFFGQNPLSVIPVIQNILNSLLIMFVPATVIVALKTVFAYAHK